MVKFYATKKSGMVRAKSGKYYYPKKRGGRGRARGASKSEMYKIAKRASLSTLKTKRHVFVGQEAIQQWGQPYGTGDPNNQWYIHFPLALAAASPTQLITQSREGPVIHWNNTTYKLQLQAGNLQFAPFRMRILAGYFKGANAVAPNALSRATLTSLFPNPDSDVDTNFDEHKNFKIIINKTTTHTPKQLYDGTDEVEDESQITKALWAPYEHRFNFKDGRKHTFMNGDGDSLVGWSPFFAIQMKPVHGESNWDLNALGTAVKSAGSAPNVNLKTITYFKDIPS